MNWEYWTIVRILMNVNVLIWLVVGLLLYKRLEGPFRLIVWLLLICLIDFVNCWLINCHLHPIARLGLVLSSLTYFLTNFIFRPFLKTGYRWSNRYHLSVDIFIAISFFFSLFFSHLVKFSSLYIRGIFSVLLAFMAIMSFTIQLRQPDPKPVTRQEWFWISIGTFLFSIAVFGNFFMFHVVRELYYQPVTEFMTYLLVLLNLMGFIAYGLALLMNARKNRLAVMKA